MKTKNIDYSEIIGNKLSDFSEIKCIDSSGISRNYTFLGHGCFGYVEKMKSIKNNQIYAIKKINKQSIESNDTEKLHFKREIKLQEKISHDNLVKFYGYFEDKENIQKFKEVHKDNSNFIKENLDNLDKNIYCLIFEYCPNGTLKDYVEKHFQNNIESKIPIDQGFVIKVFREILNALIYLKNKKILHRDIKPDNILFDENYNAKLSDFGLCALYKNIIEENDKIDENEEDNSDDEQKNIDNELYMDNSIVGHKDFVAPEIFNYQKYDFSVDVFSLGMTMFYMMTNDIPLYTTLKEIEIKKKIPIRKKKFKTISNYYSFELRKLVQKMLSNNPKKRPSIEDIYDDLLLIEFPLKNIGDTILDFEEFNGKMRYKKNFMYYYIKKFDKKATKDNAVLQKFIHKANTLFKDLRHQNIVKYYGLIEEKSPNNNNETNYYLIYEYLDRGSLSKLLKNKNDSDILTIPQNLIIKIFKQILNGLKYLHQENIAHGNIQPSKLYFDKKYNVKIGGFDILGLYEDDICKKQTINDDILFINDHYQYYGMYFSPEMIKGETWNDKADIFSLGLVIISLISTGEPIKLNRNSNGEAKRDIDLTKIKREYDIELINLVKKMIKEDPKERPTSNEVYKKLLEIENNIKKINQLNTEHQIKELLNNSNSDLISNDMNKNINNIPYKNMPNNICNNFPNNINNNDMSRPLKTPNNNINSNNNMNNFNNNIINNNNFNAMINNNFNTMNNNNTNNFNTFRNNNLSRNKNSNNNNNQNNNRNHGLGGRINIEKSYKNLTINNEINNNDIEIINIMRRINNLNIVNNNIKSNNINPIKSNNMNKNNNKINPFQSTAESLMNAKPINYNINMNGTMNKNNNSNKKNSNFSNTSKNFNKNINNMRYNNINNNNLNIDNNNIGINNLKINHMKDNSYNKNMDINPMNINNIGFNNKNMNPMNKNKLGFNNMKVNPMNINNIGFNSMNNNNGCNNNPMNNNNNGFNNKNNMNINHMNNNYNNNIGINKSINMDNMQNNFGVKNPINMNAMNNHNFGFNNGIGVINMQNMPNNFGFNNNMNFMNANFGSNKNNINNNCFDSKFINYIPSNNKQGMLQSNLNNTQFSPNNNNEVKNEIKRKDNSIIKEEPDYLEVDQLEEQFLSNNQFKKYINMKPNISNEKLNGITKEYLVENPYIMKDNFYIS